MKTDELSLLLYPPSPETGNPLYGDFPDHPGRITTCECGHDLSAHQLSQANHDTLSPCAGCVRQYGHGGCRAGGFQNAETRYEHLTNLFWAAGLGAVEAQRMQP